MIGIKDKTTEELLQRAIQSLDPNKYNSRLVSITEEINDTDPMEFFEAAKVAGKDRVFWTSTEDEFILVGAGNAWEIAAEQDRIESTEEQWEYVLKTAVIRNPYKVPGTGAVALGGMTFDPEKERSGLWESFRPSLFTIPEYIMTKQQGSCYLTINIQVCKNDHPVQLARQVQDTAKTLLTGGGTKLQNFRVSSKEEIAPQHWKETIRRATEKIQQGEAEKIVLARELRLTFDRGADISNIIRKLMKTQPNSYLFCFEKGDDCFLGATPERLVRLEEDKLLSACLAGTAPRGETKEEDERIGRELYHDRKNRQEHEFVVQMIRNALEHRCTDISIPEAPVLYPLKNLQHLYTPVAATLKDEYSIFDIVEQLHPTPALGGTPRQESLEFIRQNEQLDRGWYGAPVGWLDSNRNGEFAVAIRSSLIRGKEASLFAGCGVVADSNPEEEYQETKIKFLPMLSVLGE
ncbi:isochorismate synthase MenF [Virgibacillus xinjiangensis]|uniref:Isochorismate synthase MenF n=1 Tax=Virgibacillus xinjiangensis TaxID=393090 RepID=A0ABV7CZ31_9BACI